MAPRHYIGAVIDMYTSCASSRLLRRRDAPSEPIIATIIVVSVFSTLLLATLTFLLSRMWKGISITQSTTESNEKPPDQGTITARQQSDWARKDSNVLWSMYIEEDDLKAQFAMSPKSRLFSIGSVSTVDQGRCPLDRRQSHGNPLGQHKATETVISGAGESIDMRSRTPYERQSTPTKNLPRARALSQPAKHRHSNSFEEMVKRKQSLPASAWVEKEVHEGYNYYGGP